MSVPSKVSSLQSYHMLAYKAALHPEFFEISGRRRITHGEYEFEAWVYKGGHCLRFEHAELCVTEVVTDIPETLPDRNLSSSLPCAGERDHEAEFGDHINYVTSVQTEVLTDHLYLGTYNELLDHARECDCLITVWQEDDEKPSLSMIDTQRYNDEVHIQAYHMRSDCGLVLRTQTIFQITDGSDREVSDEEVVADTGE